MAPRMAVPGLRPGERGPGHGYTASLSGGPIEGQTQQQGEERGGQLTVLSRASAVPADIGGPAPNP